MKTKITTNNTLLQSYYRMTYSNPLRPLSKSMVSNLFPQRAYTVHFLSMRRTLAPSCSSGNKRKLWISPIVQGRKLLPQSGEMKTCFMKVATTVKLYCQGGVWGHLLKCHRGQGERKVVQRICVARKRSTHSDQQGPYLKNTNETCYEPGQKG